MSTKITTVLVSVLFFFGCNSELHQKKYESASKTSQAADDLLTATNHLNEKIETRLEENPNSAVRDFQPAIESREKELERIKGETEKIQNNRIFNSQSQFEKLQKSQQRLNTINYELNALNTSLDRELDKRLSSDIGFETGSHNLNQQGKSELQAFVFQEITRLISEWDEEEYYKGKIKKVKISITGYADLQGPRDVEKRMQINLDISRKRAESVKNQLEDFLTGLKSTYNITVELDFEGKGETAPPHLSDAERVNNPERRICMISSYVVPVF